MPPRGPPAILLCLALATAGCIGDGGTEDIGENALTSGPLEDVRWSFDLNDASRTEPVTIEETVEVPPRAGAVFVTYRGVIMDPGSELTLELDLPGDQTHPLLNAQSLASGTSSSGWQILPPNEGTWTMRATADGQARGSINLTIQPATPGPAPVTPTGDGRVVVAVVDTGINPYHEVFERPGLSTDQLPARVQEAGTDANPVSVLIERSNDLLDSLRGDASTWVQTPSQRLVHFEGTNVLGYHLDETTLPNLPVLDRQGHGTMVAHSVVRENPDALVVMITGADYDEGVTWAAEQPWIDLISLSWGPAVNLAGVAEPHAFGFETWTATRQAHDAGKLVFTATGNDPTPAFTDTTSGPPWVHAVSGAQPDTNSRAALSGNLIDTVANWTQELARYDSLDETSQASGTSFATPTTAGIASRILHDVRQAAGHTGGIEDGALVTGNLTVTASELREALNRTAVYWDTTQYGGPTDPGPSIPVAPVPAASMGWGYLDGSAVPAAVAGLLGTEELAEKPADAVAIQAANLELRQQWWRQTG